MITIDSSPAQRFGHGADESLPIAGGWVFWNRQSCNELRFFVRESRVARVALAIIVALAVFAVLQMLGVFESYAGWSVLRNVSGWVGPAAAAGAAGAAAAAAAAGAGDPTGTWDAADAAGATAEAAVWDRWRSIWNIFGYGSKDPMMVERDADVAADDARTKYALAHGLHDATPDPRILDVQEDDRAHGRDWKRP